MNQCKDKSCELVNSRLLIHLYATIQPVRIPPSQLSPGSPLLVPGSSFPWPFPPPQSESMNGKCSEYNLVKYPMFSNFEGPFFFSYLELSGAASTFTNLNRILGHSGGH